MSDVELDPFAIFHGTGALLEWEKRIYEDTFQTNLVRAELEYDTLATVTLPTSMFNVPLVFFGFVPWTPNLSEQWRANTQYGWGNYLLNDGVYSGQSIAIFASRHHSKTLRFLHEHSAITSYIECTLWRKNPKLLYAKILLKEALVISTEEFRSYDIFDVVYREVFWMIRPPEG